MLNTVVAGGGNGGGLLRWLCGRSERVAVPATVGDEHAAMAVATDCMGMRSGRGVIQKWCRSQDIVAVIDRYTRLDSHGVGRCSLPKHHARGDVRPSLQEFIGDTQHWYCYIWKRTGDRFDFLRLYRGLTIYVAWQRLREGMLL